MTKEQYELLDKFGVGQSEPRDFTLNQIRSAVRAAVNIIPFAQVQGMEEYVEPRNLTREQVYEAVRDSGRSDPSRRVAITDEIMKLIEVEKAEG